MPIFFVTYEARPSPDSEEAKTLGGAYISSGIRAESPSEASELETRAIADRAWEVIAIEDGPTLVTADNYPKEDESMEFFLRAQSKGQSYMYHVWPNEPQEEDRTH
jgi:hypothetical protein